MPEILPDMSAKQAELGGTATAFVDGETRYSFARVDVEAAALAGGLRNLGLNPGDRLAALCHNRVEFFLILFACQKAGLTLVPLNWRQPVAELLPVLDGLSPAAILFDHANAATGRALARRLKLQALTMDAPDPGETALAELLEAEPLACDGVDAETPWYLLLTSGTTGQPKAVIQTARMAWANAVNVARAVDLTSADRSINYLPLFHTAGINLYTLPVFLFGGTSTLVPRFEPDRILDLILAGGITCFFGVPAIYQAFSLHPRVDEVDWSGLRMGCGGAPLPEPLIRFFAERGGVICNGMGMTETGPTVFLMDPAHAPGKIGSVGKPQAMTQVRLAGVAQGEPGRGEIELRGPNITPGYFGNPEATVAAFTADGWLKTGDVGQRDADGYYRIVDRIKDMYISGGENVYPAEVERVLNEHPEVLEAAVIGMADERWGEVGAAFLLPRPGAAPDLDTLAPWCRERLAAYKVPKRFHLVEDFPRTAAGKIMKTELRKRL
ncbi:class I adenylate-forming enzyme family protein [Frigidibacter sp. ROC022]|uniref:class I adenylate-forming enzyme family protein n=1 Tax=Frigidibacter sp. ROC022 TaxID=2971796 RepID=UPI00215A2FF6|nr:AMP-binding protein [Frigidibacter sp. ROC022]MCR8724704.1 AMP-binding protein [Frigidibacter sp. ROC022]